MFENLPEDITYDMVQNLYRNFSEQDQKELIVATIDILGGREFKRKGIHATYVIPVLPYIGCAAVDNGNNKAPTNCKVVFNKKYINGLRYHEMTVDDLALYGFSKVKVKEIISVFMLNRNVRQHFIQHTKESLLLDPEQRQMPQRIICDTIVKRSELNLYGNNRLALLPQASLTESPDTITLP